MRGDGGEIFGRKKSLDFRYRSYYNPEKDLGAPPKAAALLPVSAAGLGPPLPYAFCRDAAARRLYKRRVRAASRSSATSSPAWRKYPCYNFMLLVFFRLFNMIFSFSRVRLNRAPLKIPPKGGYSGWIEFQYKSPFGIRPAQLEGRKAVRGRTR
jgi:hypothetical protein